MSNFDAELELPPPSMRKARAAEKLRREASKLADLQKLTQMPEPGRRTDEEIARSQMRLAETAAFHLELSGPVDSDERAAALREVFDCLGLRREVGSIG